MRSENRSKNVSPVLRRMSTYVVAAAVFCLLISASAQATIITYALDVSISGTPPAGATPPVWLTATFDDGDSAGTVDLTLEATSLIGKECVSEWLFSLDTNLDATGLTFLQTGKVEKFNDPTINKGTDTYSSAAPMGSFDIQFLFTASTNPTQAFDAGNAVTYQISGTGITADSFDVPNDTSSHPTAVLVENTGELADQNGWVSIPEVPTLVLLAFGAVGMIRRRRRR